MRQITRDRNGEELTKRAYEPLIRASRAEWAA